MSHEPIESEVPVVVDERDHTAVIDGGAVTVKAMVPRRCMRAWRCLAGLNDTPLSVRSNGGWWSYGAVFDVTGRQCDGRKLRELRTLNPGLIESRKTGNHREFRINPNGSQGAPAAPQVKRTPAKATCTTCDRRGRVIARLRARNADLVRDLADSNALIKSLSDDLERISEDRRRSRANALERTRLRELHAREVDRYRQITGREYTGQSNI